MLNVLLALNAPVLIDRRLNSNLLGIIIKLEYCDFLALVPGYHSAFLNWTAVLFTALCECHDFLALLLGYHSAMLCCTALAFNPLPFSFTALGFIAWHSSFFFIRPQIRLGDFY